MKKLKSILVASSLLALVMLTAAPASAQLNSWTSTTLQYAVSATSTTLYVASGTGIVDGMQAWIDGEIFSGIQVMPPNTSGVQQLKATRKAGHRAHPAGAQALFGQANWFIAYDPYGSCTAGALLVSPLIETDGSMWLCSSVTGYYVPGFGNTKRPKEPTVAVASAAGTITPSGPVFHVTGAEAITGFVLPKGFISDDVCIIPDGTFTTTTAGNIALASTAVVSKTLCFKYDRATTKFYPSY